MNPTDNTNSDLIDKLILVATRNLLESNYSTNSCITFNRLCKSNIQASKMCSTSEKDLVTKCKLYDKVKTNIFPGIRNAMD